MIFLVFSSHPIISALKEWSGVDTAGDGSGGGVVPCISLHHRLHCDPHRGGPSHGQEAQRQHQTEDPAGGRPGHPDQVHLQTEAPPAGARAEEVVGVGGDQRHCLHQLPSQVQGT